MTHVPQPPPGGPSLAQLQEDNGRSYAKIAKLEEELRTKCRQMSGLYSLNHALQKRISVLQRQLKESETALAEARSSQVPRVTSATRPKRALPVGVVPPDPEEKTKKMRAEPPRPSCAAKPTMRVTSASRSSTG